jgi:hypothetical protein
MGFAKLQTFCGLRIFLNTCLGIGNKMFGYRQTFLWFSYTHHFCVYYFFFQYGKSSHIPGLISSGRVQALERSACRTSTATAKLRLDIFNFLDGVMIYGIRSMDACTDLCVCAGGGGRPDGSVLTLK